MPQPPSKRKRPLWVAALRLVALAAALYLLVCVAAKLNEVTLVHSPRSGPDEWSPPPTPDIADVTFTAPDGNSIHAWWLPPPGGTKRVILYCHGKGGNLSHRGGVMADLQTQLGCGVLQFDYPGYGKSGGWPTEEACYAAAEAAMAWLADVKGVPAGEVVLFGESLGGGVASELAVRHPVRGLALVFTFTTLPDAAAHRFPFLPCHLLMSTRFDSVGKLPLVSCPVVVVHGTADDRIPYPQAEALFAAANEPKRLVRLDGAGHCEWLDPEVWAALRELVR